MAKRAALPGANELFRPTSSPTPIFPEDISAEISESALRESKKSGDVEPVCASGRVKHDHKITVYFSEDELIALEDANLELRRKFGVRVDRGRLVRTAVALALSELRESGENSGLIRVLRD